jgi:hypothetical protein
MTKVQDIHSLGLDGEEDSIDVRLSAVQQLTDLEGKAGVFRCEWITAWKRGKRGYSVLHRQKPAKAGVTCILSSQSSTASASRSKLSVVSTRKSVFMADLVQKFSSRPSAPGLHVFMASANALNSFLRVSALPFKVRSPSFVECIDRVLAMALGILVELRLPFRVDGD